MKSGILEELTSPHNDSDTKAKIIICICKGIGEHSNLTRVQRIDFIIRFREVMEKFDREGLPLLNSKQMAFLAKAGKATVERMQRVKRHDEVLYRKVLEGIVTPHGAVDELVRKLKADGASKKPQIANEVLLAVVNLEMNLEQLSFCVEKHQKNLYEAIKQIRLKDREKAQQMYSALEQTIKSFEEQLGGK